MAVDPDAALVEQAQQELPYVTTAYETLMRRYERLIHSVCLRMLGNRADAEDVSQEVLVKAFNAMESFEGRSTFKTWLMRITTNTCITMQTKRKRQGEILTELKGEQHGAGTTSLDTAAHDVETLLSQVKPEDRKLLVLRFVAELTFEEIAEVFDLGLSATKMRIYRATEELRSRIEPPS